MATKIIWKGKSYNKNLYRYTDKKMDIGSRKMVEMAKSVVPIDTGALKASIKATRVKEMEYKVGSDLDYAMSVELGTSKVSPRPFLRTAMNRIKRSF